MLNRLPMLFTSVAIGIVFAGAALVMVGSEAGARSMVAAAPLSEGVPPNAKVQSLKNRLESTAKPSTEEVGSVISTLRNLLKEGEVRNGADYLNAAMIAAKGSTEEDALLAHDLAVCSLALGDVRAKEWVAYSHDQFLTRINHKQRYGTQSKGGKLLPTVGDVPDSVRFILGVPSLLEARRTVAKGKEYSPQVKPQLEAAAPAAIAVAE
jgi:hypothetical protein